MMSSDLAFEAYCGGVDRPNLPRDPTYEKANRLITNAAPSYLIRYQSQFHSTSQSGSELPGQSKLTIASSQDCSAA